MSAMFVPFAFVSAIIMSVIGTGQKICMPLNRLAKKLTKLMWSAYGLLAAVMSAFSVMKAGKKKNMTNVALPFLFLLLHVSYGVGTLKGLLSKTDGERK